LIFAGKTPLDLLAVFNLRGATSTGERGGEGKSEGRGGKWKGKGRAGEGTEKEVKGGRGQPPKYFGLEPPLNVAV